MASGAFVNFNRMVKCGLAWAIWNSILSLESHKGRAMKNTAGNSFSTNCVLF